MKSVDVIAKFDLLASPPLHKSAYSVFGGVLSLLVSCVAVFFVSYMLFTRRVPLVTVSARQQTGGDLFEVQLTNLATAPANLTYTYPPGTPCYNAIAASLYAPMLEWTDGNPGTLGPNATMTVVLCQQRSLFRGSAAVEAIMHGLSVLAIYPRLPNRWIALVQPSGSTEFVSKLNAGLYVPVYLGRQRRVNVKGDVLSSRWLVNNKLGVALLDPYCSNNFPPLLFACERFLLSVEASFTDVVDVEVDTKFLDFVFYIIFTVVLMYSIASLVKVLFRWSKRKYNWYTARTQAS